MDLQLLGHLFVPKLTENSQAPKCSVNYWSVNFAVGASSLPLLRGGSRTKASSQWQAWSPERVEAEPLVSSFCGFFCKLVLNLVNRVALRTNATNALFAERGIVALEADWTRHDSEITDALESFGRSGVPLYLFYTPDGEVSILAQNLTQSLVRDVVVDALD